jgi:hypothetical protein
VAHYEVVSKLLEWGGVGLRYRLLDQRDGFYLAYYTLTLSNTSAIPTTILMNFCEHIPQTSTSSDKLTN